MDEREVRSLVPYESRPRRTSGSFQRPEVVVVRPSSLDNENGRWSTMACVHVEQECNILLTLIV